MNRHFKKVVVAFTITLMMTSSSFYYMPVTAFSPTDAEKSISELESLKADNNERIAELQKEIEEAQAQYDDVVADETTKIEYREALTEKIELQNQNIDYVTGQINQIDSDIEENVNQINVIETKIKSTDSEISDNTELLKERIRASYMASGDNLSSILAGSSSFYDMLAKFEVIAKVTEHDNDLIDTLQNQINELKSLKAALQTEQEQLEDNLSSEKEKKDELQDALDILGQDYMETQAELNRIDGIKTEIILTIEQRQEAVEEQEEELKKIAEDMEEIQYLLQQYAVSVSESVSASVSASESFAQSVAESKAAEASRIAEESKRIEESKKAEEAKNTQPSVNSSSQDEKPVSQAPVTEAPATPEPVAPSTETETPEPVINSSGWAWPIANGYGSITSEWGSRWGTYHKGVDITASDGDTIMGKAIVAAYDGIVVSVQNTCTHNYGKSSSCGCGGGYGRYVVIAHTDGTYATLYAHMSSATVSAKQYVSKGEIIGYAGSTGYSTGPHLHFEVHKSSTMDSAFWNYSNTVDPRNFI